MGVKFLWGILSSVKEHKTLSELRGQRLAVDLSIWVCEAQQVPGMQGTVTKPFLRNMFFRVNHLLQLGINLVFAIEGEAPELKLETMLARQQGASQGPRRGRGWKKACKPTVPANTQKPKRSRFDRLLKECCEMLDYLGVPYVQSVGEAEAMCAFLNKEGLVDGVITNDGDAFLYGARTVLRNFTMNSKDPHVECYEMDDIEHDLGLDREKLVALGLLLGCDFVPRGVPGVGRELALKLMADGYMGSILQRFKSWHTDQLLQSHVNKMFAKKPSHCSTCRHPGVGRDHEKKGCKFCGTETSCALQKSNALCPCDWHSQQTERETRSIELNVMKKALRTPEFPDIKVIREFMEAKDRVPGVHLVWRRPRLFRLQRFNFEKLEWPEEYSQEKVLPLMTLWDMRDILLGGHSSKHLTPMRIVKSRVRQGVPCFEIQWQKIEIDNTTESTCYTTIEERDIFSKCFPQLVTQFQNVAEAKAASKKIKKKGNTDVENLTQTKPEGGEANHDSSLNSVDQEDDSLTSVTSTLRQLTLNGGGGNQQVMSVPPNEYSHGQHLLSPSSVASKACDAACKLASSLPASEFRKSSCKKPFVHNISIASDAEQGGSLVPELGYKSGSNRNCDPEQKNSSDALLQHEQKCNLNIWSISGQLAEPQESTNTNVGKCLGSSHCDSSQQSDSEDEYVPLSQRLLMRNVQIKQNSSPLHSIRDSNPSQHIGKSCTFASVEKTICKELKPLTGDIDNMDKCTKSQTHAAVIADFDESVISGTLGNYNRNFGSNNHKRTTKTPSADIICSTSGSNAMQNSCQQDRQKDCSRGGSVHKTLIMSNSVDIDDDVDDADSSVELFEVTEVTLQDTIFPHPPVKKGASKSRMLQQVQDDTTLPLPANTRFRTNRAEVNECLSGRSVVKEDEVSCTISSDKTCTESSSHYAHITCNTAASRSEFFQGATSSSASLPKEMSLETVVSNSAFVTEKTMNSCHLGRPDADVIKETHACQGNASKDFLQPCNTGKLLMAKGSSNHSKVQDVKTGKVPKAHSVVTYSSPSAANVRSPTSQPIHSLRMGLPGILQSPHIDHQCCVPFSLKSPITPCRSPVHTSQDSPCDTFLKPTRTEIGMKQMLLQTHSTPHFQNTEVRKSNLTLWNSSQVGNFQIETSVLSNLSTASDIGQHSELLPGMENLNKDINSWQEDRELACYDDKNIDNMCVLNCCKSNGSEYGESLHEHLEVVSHHSTGNVHVTGQLNDKSETSDCHGSIPVRTQTSVCEVLIDDEASGLDLFASYEESTPKSSSHVERQLKRNYISLHDRKGCCLQDKGRNKHVRPPLKESTVSHHINVAKHDSMDSTPTDHKDLDLQDLSDLSFQRLTTVSSLTNNEELNIEDCKKVLCTDKESNKENILISSVVKCKGWTTQLNDITPNNCNKQIGGGGEQSYGTSTAMASPLSLMDRLRQRLASAEENNMLVCLSQSGSNQVSARQDCNISSSANL